MKRGQNWRLKERTRAKEIKKCNYIDKIVLDAIGVASISHETFII
jgi:hypothetical protein